MTRLRARGGIRDRPPIIDDDDDDLFRAAPPAQPTRKRKAGAGRKPVAEKVVERIGKSKQNSFIKCTIYIYNKNVLCLVHLFTFVFCLFRKTIC